MTSASTPFEPGQRIRHGEFGEGVVVGAALDGYLRVFFTDGERQVAATAIEPLIVLGRPRAYAHVEGTSIPP